jgi:hypothetical protein
MQIVGKRTNHWIVADDRAYSSEEQVEVQVKLSAVLATLIADPKGSGF